MPLLFACPEPLPLPSFLRAPRCEGSSPKNADTASRPVDDELWNSVKAFFMAESDLDEGAVVAVDAAAATLLLPPLPPPFSEGGANPSSFKNPAAESSWTTRALAMA